MRRNDEIQAAIVVYLKSNSTITGTVSAEEIREDQYQGREFSYPNVRVRLISNTPIGSDDCELSRVNLSIMVFTEDASSLNADRIAGIINSVLHGRSFASNGIAFYFRTTNLIPAIRSNIQEWRSEILINVIASG